MAPEQLAGQPGDWRSDQFSFCVSLYEILYGERPFAGPDVDSLRAQIIARRVREADRRSGVPAWLRRVVLRGLSPVPEDRWPSMEALIRTLDPRRGPDAPADGWAGAGHVGRRADGRLAFGPPSTGGEACAGAPLRG